MSIGQWAAKQKDGKNWVVEYNLKVSGEVVQQNRKFRIKADALAFVKEAKQIFAQDERASDVSFKVDKTAKALADEKFKSENAQLKEWGCY